MASRKRHPARRAPATLVPAVARLQAEVDRLRVMVEALEKHHMINVRRFGELQIEVDRLKGASASRSSL